MDRIIDIIGAEMDKAASKPGCGLGPSAIRNEGLIPALTRLAQEINLEFNDLGDVSGNQPALPAPESRLNNLGEVNAVNTLLYDKILSSLKNGHFPIVLGGDHSVAAASGSAMLTHHGKIGIIWVDAHGDFNNAFSSPSGNIHGTPLSALTGGGPEEILPFKPKNSCYIDPKNAVLIGARDLDDEEKVLLAKAGATVFGMEQIHRDGIEKITAAALEIAGGGTNGVYLSFDLDGLDPCVLKGLGTPVDDGITLPEALTMCKMIASSGNLLGAEVVELNPLLDPEATAPKVAINLITTILKSLKA